MFLASKKIAGRKDSSLRAYRYELMKFKTIIDKPFKDVTTMDIRYYLAILKEKYKNTSVTVRSKYHKLNTFYAFLETEEIITKNPMKRIDPIKTEKVIKKSFSKTEMELLRNACSSTRDRALIEFLWSTGLRVSECCSLNVRDVLSNNQEFSVVGKGSKERIGYVSDVNSFYLMKYLKERCKIELCTLEELYDKPLFVKIKKPYGRLTKDGVEWIVSSIGNIANVDNVYPHRFRRTFATTMLERGMPIEELKVLLGHSKLDTTLLYCDIKQSSIKRSYDQYTK